MERVSKYIVVCCLIITYWTVLLPGPRVSGDFHYSYQENVRSLWDFPYVWSTRWGGGLGDYVSTLWAWPYELLYGLLGNAGVSFSVTERVAGVLLSILLGYLGIVKLLSYYKIEGVGGSAGIIFFLTNSYLILLLDGGQLNLALGYSLLPLSYFYYRNFIDSFKRKSLFLFTFSILGISVVDLRVVVLLTFLILVNFLFDLIWQRNIKDIWLIWKRNTVLGLFSGAVLILFNAYWIFPLVISGGNYFVPAKFSSPTQINFLSFSTLGNGLFFQQPHWYKNDFGQIADIRVEFLLIPLLVFLAPILKRGDKNVSFWLVVTVVFIFLSKGTQDPFPAVNRWLFEQVPIFVLFRDPTKFYFLIAVGFSVLIAMSVDRIAKLFTSKRRSVLLSLILAGYFLFLNRPVILLQMNGLLAPPIYQQEYRRLSDLISLDDNFGRVVWIPVKAPLGFESPKHPAVDAFNLLEKRPFAIGVKGTYEKLNFFRVATFSGELLDVSGVQSIVYPPLDLRKKLSDDQKKYYTVFLNQLKRMPYIKGQDVKSEIPKLDLKQYQERFFLPDNLWWVIGDDRLYSESTKSAELSLSKNGIVFAEEFTGLGEKIKSFPSAKVLLRDKTVTDFAASFLKNNEFIFPAKKLKKEPDASGWWKRETDDLVGWKDFLISKYGINNQDFDYGGGWAVAEGNLETKIASSKISKGKVLLVRVLESIKSGKLRFNQGEAYIGEIDTKKTGDIFRWFEVGKLASSDNLKISSDGEINVVNALGIVEEDRWKDLEKSASDILKSQQVESYQNGDTNQQKPMINFRKINPTEYEINVTGIKKPQLIVFSESFSPLWQMENQSSLPVYSLLNGFLIDKDGSYKVSQVAQKYVYPGLIVSFLSLLTVVFGLLKR